MYYTLPPYFEGNWVQNCLPCHWAKLSNLSLCVLFLSCQSISGVVPVPYIMFVVNHCKRHIFVVHRLWVLCPLQPIIVCLVGCLQCICIESCCDQYLSVLYGCLLSVNVVYVLAEACLSIKVSCVMNVAFAVTNACCDRRLLRPIWLMLVCIIWMFTVSGCGVMWLMHVAIRVCCVYVYHVAVNNCHVCTRGATIRINSILRIAF